MKYLLPIALLLLAGCEPVDNPQPVSNGLVLSKWRVAIETPQGKEKAAYFVYSHNKPTVDSSVGGNLWCYSPDKSRYEWEGTIVAPVGWYMTVTKVNEAK